MLIGIDSSSCSLSLRNRSTLSSTTKCHQNKSDLKNVFVQNLFFSISSILSIPIMLIGINGGYFPAICRLCFFYLFVFSFSVQSRCASIVSSAAIFRQSAGYVLIWLGRVNLMTILCRGHRSTTNWDR